MHRGLCTVSLHFLQAFKINWKFIQNNYLLANQAYLNDKAKLVNPRVQMYVYFRTGTCMIAWTNEW